MDRIGKRIAELRKEQRKTQKEVAAAVGVGVPCLSLWENGKRKINPRQLSSIAAFFCVSVDSLIPPEEEPQQATEQDKQELIQLIKQMDNESLDLANALLDIIRNQENIKENQEQLNERINALLDYLK